MKKEISFTESEKDRTHTETDDNEKRNDENVKRFFQKFSDKYHKLEKTASKKENDEWNAEIQQLDENTAPYPVNNYLKKENELSPEEFHQLEENDAGYVNGLVLDYDNKENRFQNIYQTTGLHKNAIHWGDYAIEGSEEYVFLEKGMVLSRWGDENGTFMSDKNTDFESLELPTIKEKNEQKFYEVRKPFPVEVSTVAVQPWNENKLKKDTGASQFRTPVRITELLKDGYLKEIK